MDRTVTSFASEALERRKAMLKTAFGPVIAVALASHSLSSHGHLMAGCGWTGSTPDAITLALSCSGRKSKSSFVWSPATSGLRFMNVPQLSARNSPKTG